MLTKVSTHDLEAALSKVMGADLRRHGAGEARAGFAARRFAAKRRG